MQTCTNIIRLVSFLLLFVGFNGLLVAQTTFIGAANGSWFTASNWSNGLPASGNNAILPGGSAVTVASPLTINFNVENYGTMDVSANINVTGTFANASALNMNGSAKLTNSGTFQNFGNATFASTASFANASGATFSNNGTFILPTTLMNSGNITNNGTINAADGLVQSSGTFENGQVFTTKTLTLATGSTFTNNFGAILNISGVGAAFTSEGNLTNNGAINNAGVATIKGAFTNNVDYNNLAGGTTTIAVGTQFNNGGTFTNKSVFVNNGTFLNSNKFVNEGTATNNSSFAQNNRLENKATGTFTNNTGATISMGFGSVLLNAGVFLNKNELASVGTITNDSTFTNDGILTNNSGSMLVNNKIFINNNTINSFNAFTNNGNFTNNLILNVGSGSILINNGIFKNSTTGTINNQFEIVNKAGGSFENLGSFNNVIRLFVDGGTFKNTAHLNNVGDIFTKSGGTLQNIGLLIQTNGNIKNEGALVNSAELISDDCSTIVNTGSINNTGGSLKLRGVLFQRGTLSGAAITSQGGYTHTNATANAPSVCANKSISADRDGLVKAYATGLVAFANFDSCQNIIYRANGLARPTFTCSDIGTIQNLNVSLVTRLGDSLTCVSQVTPMDILSPTFENCPTEIVVYTPNSTASATWTAPTVTDNCSGEVTVTSTAVSGASFPIGINIVEYTAVDARNNSQKCQFKVSVIKTAGTANCTGDVTAPVIANCPSSFSIATSQGSAIATWAPPTITDNCYPLSLTSNFISGTTFQLGKDTIIYTARDGNGNTSTCQFVITVVPVDLCSSDLIKPSFGACPANIYMPTNPLLNGGLALWSNPAVSDNCALTSLTSSHQSGSIFPIGTTTVTYLAQDASNNSASCSFTITVGADPCPGDVTGPVFAGCPANITQNINSGNTAVVTWTAPTTTDACAPINLASNYTPGGVFPVGNTQVVYQASDIKGNKTTCAFNVTVLTPCLNDNIAPVISGCPSNVTVATASSTEAAATWTAPFASDNCGIASFVSSYVSGAVFPLGVTSVVYTATDTKGNTASCVFNVSVVGRPLCATNASPINNSTAIATNSLDLSWNAVANATAYDVYLGITNPPTTLIAPNVSSTSITAINLNGGTDYYWYVLPKNGAGGAIGCNSVTKFTTAGTPQGGGSYTINNSLPICKGTTGTGLTHQVWNNITGTLITDLTANATYPNSPSTTAIIAASKSVWNIADNYGTRVRGFVTPTVTGNYTFTITGDDQTQLFFSQNDNPNNKFLIANIDSWTGETEFTKFASQKSSSFSMVAGQNYYIELLHKEHGGGDGWGIYWTAPGTTTIVPVPLSVLSPITNDCGTPAVSAVTIAASSRVSNGLVALYDFKEGSGATVNDVSGFGTPLNLNIANTANVTRLPGSCGLRINTATVIKPALGVSSSKIATALNASNAMTIEAWVKPTNITQNGPAGIVSYSANTTTRNFSLGQTTTTYVARVRTSTTDVNGSPQVSSGAFANTNLQHVVYTRDAFGYEAIFVDNELFYEGTRTGTLNFNNTYTFLLGNELTNTRPWLGEIHLVAVYNRALTLSEIGQNYHVGVCSQTNLNICTRNLVANGGFEKDFFGYDNTNSPTIVTNPVASGTKAASLCNSDDSVRESFRATPGTAYTMTISARLSGIPTSPVVGIRFLNSSSTQIGSALQHTVTGSASYSTYTITATAPTDAYWVQIYGSKPGLSGCLLLDNICVKDASLCENKFYVVNNGTCVSKVYKVLNGVETFVADVAASSTFIFNTFDTQVWRLRRSADGILIREHTISGCNEQTITITSCGTADTGGGTQTGCPTDTQAPVISACPANITVNSTTTTATATWTPPTATDNCGTPLRASNFNPGTSFPLGTTVVRYTAMDTKGNLATCQFSVTVNNACASDVTAPIITCPANVTQATTATTASVTWTAPVASDNCSTPAVSSNFLPGSNFAPGVNVVRYTAVDAKGNTSTCTFNVTVNSSNPCANDNVPPVFIGCPNNISATTAGTFAIVSWQSPIVTDNCGTPQFVGNTVPGANFSIGTFNAKYSATDYSGNITTCLFTITVTQVGTSCATDATKPVINNCPTSQTLTATGTSAVATWTAPTATDNCPGAVSLTASATPGSSFPVGATVVTYTASDAKGNTDTCSFTITVNAPNPCATDATKPIINNCPTSQTLTATGTSAVATWTAPTATDNCPGAVSLTASATPGSSFPIGATVVTYTATDAKGNTDTCSFTITVNAPNPCATDVTKPIINNCPTSQTLTVTGTSATASWTAPTATDNCPGAVSLTASATPNSSFPIGATVVTYTATDAKGNTATCSFTITVNAPNPCATDATKPVITNCPSSQTLTTTGTSAIATWTAPTATDNCPGAVSLTASATPGSSFPIGATVVTYTATDAKGNTATCSFTITVSAASNPNDCNNISIAGVGSSIEVSGLTAPIVLIQIFNSQWTKVFTCSGNCAIPNQSIPNLPSGTYFVKVDFLNSSWGAICKKEQYITLTGVATPVVTLNCAPNISVVAAQGATTAQVTYTAPVGTSTCATGTVTTVKTSGLNSGSAFPIGVSGICYTATDACGTTKSCCFNVTVTAAPASVVTLNCPANITITAASGATGANVTYVAPTGTSTCSTGTTSTIRTSGLASGSLFPIGNSQVCYTATDGCGTTKSCCFTITVNTPPPAQTGCDAISITPGINSITVSGLTAPVVLIQIFNSQWAKAFSCSGNECTKPTQIISNLPAGTYFVKVDFLNASWVAICKKEQYITVSSNAVVANQALVFNAYRNESAAELKWVSNTGERNDYFVVEHSTDGQAWHEIAQQDGKGEAGELLYFDYTHLGAVAGENLYRLRLHHRDQQITYSDVRSVFIPNPKSFSLFPNPTSEAVNMEASAFEGQEGYIIITNALGIALKQQFIPSIGKDPILITLEGLESGFYQVSLQSEGVIRTAKLVVNK